MSNNQKSQIQIIRGLLLAGETITSMEAFKLFGITRLSGIIHSLRGKQKIPIVTLRIKGENNNWCGKYRIPPAKLKEVGQVVFSI